MRVLTSMKTLRQFVRFNRFKWLHSYHVEHLPIECNWNETRLAPAKNWKKEEKTPLNVHLLYHLFLFEWLSSNQPNTQSFVSYVEVIIESENWMEDLFSAFCFQFAVHMAALKLSTPTKTPIYICMFLPLLLPQPPLFPLFRLRVSCGKNIY